jgi:hypothetical protein
MPFIYLILSIAGWSALALFLGYWAIVAWRRRRGIECQQRREFDVIQSPADHHENQP